MRVGEARRRKIGLPRGERGGAEPERDGLARLRAGGYPGEVAVHVAYPPSALVVGILITCILAGMLVGNGFLAAAILWLLGGTAAVILLALLFVILVDETPLGSRWQDEPS